MTPVLIGTADAARILAVTTRTVHGWATKGTLPTERKTVGGHRRFALADVEALRDRMRAREQGATCPTGGA